MPKISVIVPVYKVEPYLAGCVDSLLAQTLQDIEIVLVDDGSPDGCGGICDEYAARDSRIRVIHQGNQGLPGARNSGLRAASGDYVGFVDSDDYIDPDMFEKLYEAARENDADFVMCDYIRESVDGQTPVTKDISGGFYDKARLRTEVYPQLIMGEDIDFGPILSVCCCMYKRDFLCRCGLLFDEKVQLSEDCLFSSCAGYFAERFVYLKGHAPYHYIFNPESLSHSYKPFAWSGFCRMNDEFRRIFDGSDFDFSRQFDLHMLYFTLNMLRQIRSADFTFAEKNEEIRKVLHTPQVRRAMSGFRIPRLPWKLYVMVLLVKYGAVVPLAMMGE